MPRGILQGDNIEMLVGERQVVDITDGAVDLHAELACRFLPHGLHGLAAVHGVDLQVHLFLQEGDANGVGAGAQIQHLLPILHVDG